MHLPCVIQQAFLRSFRVSEVICWISESKFFEWFSLGNVTQGFERKTGFLLRDKALGMRQYWDLLVTQWLCWYTGILSSELSPTCFDTWGEAVKILNVHCNPWMFFFPLAFSKKSVQFTSWKLIPLDTFLLI